MQHAVIQYNLNLLKFNFNLHKLFLGYTRYIAAVAFGISKTDNND